MDSEWGISNPPAYGKSGLDYNQMQETWSTDKTISLIEQYKDAENPFMIMTSFKGPHWDYMVPEPYDKMYDPRSIEKWGNFDDPFINKPEIQQERNFALECWSFNVERLARDDCCVLGILYIHR